MESALFGHLNYWAIFLSACSYLLLGWVWYSPILFGGMLGEEKPTLRPVSLALFAVAAWLISFGIAVILELAGVDLMSQGMAVAGLACLCLVGSVLVAQNLLRGKGWPVFFVHFGFHFGAWIGAGALLGYF